MPRQYIDLTGKRFGKLVVLQKADVTQRRRRRWFCQCDCGTTKSFDECSLKSGRSASCGCNRIIQRSHGMSATRTYRIWKGMIQRCYNSNNPIYHHYGKRGISVCDRWRHNFQAFLDDMGACPSKQFSIDRINNDGNYEPGNCRWATDAEQARNMRHNVMVEHDGETLCVTDWAKRVGIDITTIYQRLNKGFTITDAIFMEKMRKPNLVTFEGETKTITEWAKVLGMDARKLRKRIIDRKWSVHDAFTLP